MELLLATSVVGRNEKKHEKLQSGQTVDEPCAVNPNALHLQPETLAKSCEQDNATSDAKKDKTYLD